MGFARAIRDFIGWNAAADIGPADPGKTKFGYDAAEAGTRRKSAGTTVKSENVQLTCTQRARLDNSVENLDRNLGLAQWLIDTYINYTSRFVPHVNTGDQKFDARLVRALEIAARAKNFSLNRRMSMQEGMQLLQRSRLVHGDGAWLKVAGGRIQGIPGNRIALAKSAGDDKAGQKLLDDYRARCSASGMELDPDTGEILRYCLLGWSKDGKLVFDHIEDAANMIYLPHVRTFDQVKGTTRLASIVNQLVDLAEVHEYTRLKIKLHATFGFMLSEDDPTGLPQRDAVTNTVVAETEEGEVVGTSSTSEAKIDLNTTPWIVQAPEGARLDLVESKQPSAEFLDYVQSSVRDAMLSLGLPYTLYDGARASFSSRIADVNQLEYAIGPERDRMRGVAEAWGDWKVEELCSDGGLLHADMLRAGLTVEEVQYLLEFVHVPAPWVDAKKQIEGDQLAVGACLDSIPRICARRGVSWRDVIDENAEVLDYARSKGVPVYTATPGSESATTGDAAESADPDDSDAAGDDPAGE